MWHALPKIVNTLEKPVTELRDPIWSWEWSTKAFLSHFALGYLLGMLVVLLTVLVARQFGASKISKWDFRRMKGGEQADTFFEKVRNWIERLCLGWRYESLLLDLFSFALRISFFSAVVANLIDLDHLPLFWGGPDRILHPLGFAVAVLIAVYCGARIVGAKSEYAIRRYSFWLCLALSIMAHVLEDYLLGWF